MNFEVAGEAGTRRTDLFGRGSKKREQSKPVDLDQLIAHFGQGVAFWLTQPGAEMLAQARFADACRDAVVQPVPLRRFAESWEMLTEQARLRFSIALSALDVESAAHRLPVICHGAVDAQPALNLFHGFANRLELLTAELIQQSDVRLEEFSRHFCSLWGLTILNENEAVSAARIHDIDFARLIKAADAARSSAEDRMAYLRKLQEEQEATRRPRRGKW